MSETKKIRSELDRLGVEYRTYGSAHMTAWDTPTGSASFMEGDISEHHVLTILGLTAEQAIAATLGSSKSEQGSSWTAEQVRETVEKHWHDLPAEYDMPEATALPEYSYDWHAIADELNATLGGGECSIEKRNGDWYCTGCGEMVGTCDTASELHIDGNAVELWNHCPRCGKAVKR